MKTRFFFFLQVQITWNDQGIVLGEIKPSLKQFSKGNILQSKNKANKKTAL